MANSFEIQLTAAQLAALSAKAKEIGINPGATSGTLPESHGVALSYQITGSDNGTTIHFDVIHKPTMVSVSMIENHVKGLLNG